MHKSQTVRLGPALLLGALVLLIAAPAALAALTVTRAELSGNQLRVDGQGAKSKATITIDGVAMGTADRRGKFSISRSGFSSSTCVITVSDGTSSTQATLSGCTPAGPPPPPSPPPPPPATASFQGLGVLPGWDQSQGWGVSGDGSAVVGQVSKLGASTRCFRWTPQKGMQDLRQALLNAGVTAVNDWILLGATGVSADGTVIVGEGINPAKQREAFRVVLSLPT